jgi:SAM-dependent methyltransferase
MKGNVLRAVELSDPTLPEPAPSLRLDIGCGKTTPEGWVGIDRLDFGQAVVADVSVVPWSFKSDCKALPVEAKPNPKATGDWDLSHWVLPDNSVDEVRSSHFVEHLTGAERVEFFNELWRVMKPNATALIITPNWSHSCAYGDPTHQWPPMSQWYPLYLHRDWRAANAPHAPFTCHFDHVIAGSWDQSIESRNQEAKSFMMDKYVNAWRDLIVTLTKR